MILWLILGCAGGWLAHAAVARMRARAVARRVSELHAHAEHASMLAEVEAIFAEHERALEDRIEAAFAAVRRAAPIDRAVAVSRGLVVASGVPRLELERARRDLETGAAADAIGRALVRASQERTLVPLSFEGREIGVLAVGGADGIMHSHALEAACQAIAVYLGRAVARAERSTVRWDPDRLSASA